MTEWVLGTKKKSITVPVRMAEIANLTETAK